MNQVRKRYKNFKFSWKMTGKVVCFLGFLFIVSFLFNQFKKNPYFNIKEVKIVGATHMSHEEIKQSLLPLVNKGFFIVDVSLIKERLKQFSWVSEASVRRVWPNQIHIQIQEKRPLAYWNHSQLLTTAGEIVTPMPTKALLLSELPHFIGPQGEQMQILNYYARINGILAPLHFKITQLELTPSRSWQLTFNNGIKLNVGEKESLTRISHFVKVYPKIVGARAKEVDSIDLRYPNGLAVRWKT